MIDFHSHILPEIDDGSTSMDETISLIKEAAQVRLYRNNFNITLYTRIL